MHLIPILTLVILSLVWLQAADRKPNVVIFLADDAGWGDYSHNGNTQIKTANIDAIAQGGVTLDRYYVFAVCSPTRAEFLTGRYHQRGGVRGVSTGQERLNPDEIILLMSCVQLVMLPAHLANGTMAANGRTIRWPVLFRNILAIPPGH